MKEIISTYAPGVTEVFAAVEVQEKTKAVEIENKLFSSKSALSGLKDHTMQNEGSFVEQTDGLEA